MAARQENSVNIEQWLKLRSAENVGSVTFARLLNRFGSVDRALGASVSELTKVEGIGFKTAERIAMTRGKFDVESELELANKLGVWVINIEDQRYPTLLRTIYDPPPVLYIRGTLSKSDNLSIAIVGCRRCSLYGQEQASRFGHLLGAAGFTICSGLARGIDTAAHKGALSAKARTLAVLGCGLANMFPPENIELSNLIAESGACISELPLRCEPLAENFPARNRIIAGLSLGTIVVEAPQRSGALITARASMEYNREVMAVPGKIDSPLSKGSHQLIKQGAKLIETVEDVTEGLGYIGREIEQHVSSVANKAVKNVETPLFDVSQLNLTKAEKLIYDCLGSEPIYIDEIIAESDLSPGSINAGLVSLRLKGLITQLPGSMFARR